jgi:DNA-binding MarR family transcriptional regulator
MHSSPDGRRDRNVLAAWATAVSDAVRVATEQSTGMGGNGPAALVAIVADPGLGMDDLRKVLALTQPGTVRLVDRLVEQGWVRRRQGPGRAVRLEPTAAGHGAERRVAVARERAVAEVLAGLSEQDIHVMAGLADPVLAATVENVDAMRRLCRLCDRSACEPCPAEDGPTPGHAPPAHAET